MNEAIHTALQVRVCANNTLTPTYIDQTGVVTARFGKPFKMNEDSGRNKAIVYAKQCGYQPNDRLYGDKYYNKYAIVIANTSPETYMFFDTLELVPLLSI